MLHCWHSAVPFWLAYLPAGQLVQLSSAPADEPVLALYVPLSQNRHFADPRLIW